MIKYATEDTLAYQIAQKMFEERITNGRVFEDNDRKNIYKLADNLYYAMIDAYDTFDAERYNDSAKKLLEEVDVEYKKEPLVVMDIHASVEKENNK